MRATLDIPPRKTRSRVTAPRGRQPFEVLPSNCKGCADAYGRLVSALARFQTVGKIAAMTGEERCCIHDRLAGEEPIDMVSWKALSGIARSMKLRITRGNCAQCGAAVVLPAR